MPQRIEVTRQDPKQTAVSMGIGIFQDAHNRGINVSQLLENMDPTMDRKPEDRGLDAFERVMKEAGIIAAPVHEYGMQASEWGDATDSNAKRAIMHEFACRIWRHTTNPQTATNFSKGLISAGERSAILLSGDSALNTITNLYADNTTPRAKRLVPPIPLSELVARTTAIDAANYRTLYITDDFGTDAYRLKRVMEGANIPMTTLVTGSHTLQIHKFGRGLLATYEQLRRQRLDRVAFIIARMALQAEVDKVAIALNTLINGDGNANTSAAVLTETGLDAAGSAGTMTLKAYLTFRNRFGPAYIPDIILGQEAAIIQTLLMPVNTVNGIPLALLQPGALGSITPIQPLLSGGLRYGITPDAPALKLIALDSGQALERVTEIGGQVSEVDRFIQNQTTILTMTEVEGYGIIDPNAYKVFNINA